MNLCNLISPDRFKTNVCTFQTGEFEKELKKGQSVFTLVNGNSRPKSIIRKGLNFVDRIKLLNQILKEESIDILHTHHLGPFIHALPTLRKRQSIKWLHTEHPRPDIDGIYSKSELNVCKYLFRFPDILTGVSNATSSYFYNDARVPKDKVITILNGVDTEQFTKLEERTFLRKELKFSENEQIIGIVGNLRKEKNHKTLINAFSKVHCKLPSSRLIIIGDGECRRELEELVSELDIVDYVHFLGYRLDVPEIMSAIDVYCLPSSFEGMPLSIIEAWAVGKPVVATDVIGIKELVRHGENGVLVPSDNPERLAEGLIKVLIDGNLREKISRNGQKFALENCTVERMVKQYEDLYLKLMNGKVHTNIFPTNGA